MSSSKYSRCNPRRIPATSTPNSISDNLLTGRSNKTSILNNGKESDSESSSSSSEATNSSVCDSRSYTRTENVIGRSGKFNKSESKTLGSSSKLATHGFITNVRREYVCGILSTAAFAILFTFVYTNNLSKNMDDCDFVSIKEIQEKFPLQPQDTFDAIVSGVNEVKLFNKPSMFIFLYDSNARQIVDSFAQVIAHYASIVLNDDCKVNPILLTSSSFNTVKAKTDYGEIISTYKPLLEERTVMIIKNLDKIPGHIAQAFHAMCDEHSPLVPKAFFIFTIEIKETSKHYKSYYDYVEQILRNSWSDLDDDTFYPLFTRISSMLLKIEH